MNKNNQIKLINHFIKNLYTKIINNEKFYVLRADELLDNTELLDFCINFEKELVSNFINKNWSNIKKAKKRVITTIKNCLKIFGIEIIKKQIAYDATKDNGKKYQSTKLLFLFKWSDEYLNQGEFQKIDRDEKYKTYQKIYHKKYDKEYYLKNKERIDKRHKENKEKKYA
jgi:hypothetical protein